MTEVERYASLMRYVDGEMAGGDLVEVSAMLAGDGRALRTVEELRAGRAVVRASFANDAEDAVPEALRQRVAAIAARRGAVPAPGRRPFLAWAAAAALGALVVGAGDGYFAASYRIEQRLAAVEQAQVADRAALLAAMSVALEENVSGVSVEWTAPGSGVRGRVTPVRTFKSSGGQWCREYAAIVGRKGQPVREDGVACRDAGGVWRTRIEIAEES